MSQLNLKPDQPLPSVEDSTFEPIKGYPMLHWKSKRPFRSTQYYPAQLKEVHGEATRGWLNKIFWGDNLQVMSHLLKNYRGQVDLVYIDPPFDSKADYKKKISLKGKNVENDTSAFEEKQYTDIWSNDEYLQFMYERLILLRELLCETGTIFLHCDDNKSHHLRCLLDEIFGQGNFLNEIIHCYSEREKIQRTLNRRHQTIFWYAKNRNSEYTFNAELIREDFSESTIKKYKYSEPNGRKFRIRGMNRVEAGDLRAKSDLSLEDECEYTYRDYLDARSGPAPKDWFVMPFLNQASNERENYPTQKNSKILEKLIISSSNPGDLIFDCFMGSGTTQAVAMKLGRRFIGADINLGAIQTTTKRLLGVASDLRGKQIKAAGELPLMAAEPALGYGEEGEAPAEKPITEYYTGFEVFNVNHYDVFRNPVEAKDLLIKALEIRIRPAKYTPDPNLLPCFEVPG